MGAVFRGGGGLNVSFKRGGLLVAVVDWVDDEDVVVDVDDSSVLVGKHPFGGSERVIVSVSESFVTADLVSGGDGFSGLGGDVGCGLAAAMSLSSVEGLMTGSIDSEAGVLIGETTSIEGAGTLVLALVLRLVVILVFFVGDLSCLSASSIGLRLPRATEASGLGVSVSFRILAVAGANRVMSSVDGFVAARCFAPFRAVSLGVRLDLTASFSVASIEMSLVPVWVSSLAFRTWLLLTCLLLVDLKSLLLLLAASSAAFWVGFRFLPGRSGVPLVVWVTTSELSVAPSPISGPASRVDSASTGMSLALGGGVM